MIHRLGRSVSYFAPKEAVLRDGLVVDSILALLAASYHLTGAAVRIVFRSSVA